ncbi:hypothetical protein TWF718_001577 [Orbilia javanica]|uniref:Sec20 C-terminal domain-containing protein n=1 Tax=Orbilia javanica TaxID=47235 RepID=A0AAN8N8V2_9PEZI
MSAASSEISERTAILTNAYQEVTTYIDRLANLTAPGTEEARNELAGLIHQSLKEGDAELETLTLQTATLNPSTDPQAALHSRLHKLQEDFRHARTNYRKSLLYSKRSSTLNARREREAILLHQQLQPSLPTSPTPSSPNNDNASLSTSTASLPPQATAAIPGSVLYRRPYHQTSKSKRDTQSDLLASASSDVTTALRRTHALMTSELNRSHFASQTLAQSTETLKQLGTSYSSFDNVISKSKGLITDLVKRNKSDMWYYQMSLYALVGTIGWLIFRRLLWGPMFLVVWLPLRMLIWMVLMPFKGSQTDVSVGGSGNVIGTVETMVGGGGNTQSEVRKVVESIIPQENAGGNVIEEPSVKKVILSNGEEVEVSLKTPADPVMGQGEWVEADAEGSEGSEGSEGGEGGEVNEGSEVNENREGNHDEL